MTSIAGWPPADAMALRQAVTASSGGRVTALERVQRRVGVRRFMRFVSDLLDGSAHGDGLDAPQYDIAVDDSPTDQACLYEDDVDEMGEPRRTCRPIGHRGITPGAVTA